jgi:hypothetical protein
MEERRTMRHKMALLAVVLTLGVGAATSVAAQPTREAPAPNVETRDNAGDGFDLGWLGLIGLAGLLGLKRRSVADGPVVRSEAGHSSTAR